MQLTTGLSNYVKTELDCLPIFFIWSIQYSIVKTYVYKELKQNSRLIVVGLIS